MYTYVHADYTVYTTLYGNVRTVWSSNLYPNARYNSAQRVLKIGTYM